MPINQQQARPQPGDFGLSKADDDFESIMIFHNDKILSKFIVFCGLVILCIIMFSLHVEHAPGDADASLSLLIFLVAGLSAFPVVFRLWPRQVPSDAMSITKRYLTSPLTMRS